MPSPACEVQNGAGPFVTTANGVDVTPGNTITIRLISQADVNSWSISALTTDELSDAAAVSAALVIDPVLKTATYTAPTSGRNYRFQSLINGGIGPDGVAVASYRTTFCINTRFGDKRVVAADETIENDSTFGYIRSINELIRGSVVFPLSTPDATPARIRRYPIADSTIFVLRAIVSVQNDVASKYGTYEVKATYQRTGGVLSAVDGPTVTTVVESDAGLDVTVTMNGSTDVDVNVVGLVATDLTWKLTELTL